MTSSIPNTLPATVFPALDSRFDAPISSKRPSSYREERAVRCRNVPKQADQVTDPNVLARNFASFVLLLTGEDEVVFTFHHADAENGDKSRDLEGQSDGTSVPGHVVYATRQDAGNNNEPSPKCMVSIVAQPEGVVTTDFALVLGQAPSEALKPFTAILFEDTLTVSFANELIPEPFEDVLIDTLQISLTEYASSDNDGLPLSVLNHPPQTSAFLIENEGSTDKPVLLHSEFLKRAQEHPDRPALDFLRTLDDQSGEHDVYTYDEFNRLSSELASHILQLTQSATLNCGHLVIPAFLSTSPELYICWLAVLKADCAFAPLPIDAPIDRIQGILEETSSTVVLGRGPVPDNLKSLVSPSAEPPCQWVDVTAFVGSRRQWENHRPGLSPSLGLPSIKSEDLAYVMYTSGSTGKPKGVQITHSSAACSISSHVAFAVDAGLTDGEAFRWFQFAAPTFDPSVMEIWTTLSLGGTLCFCERTTGLTDPESAITALKATIMMATPSMAALLRPEKVPTLKHLWTMGETLGRKVIENFASDSTSRAEGDIRHLLNAYGPTEGSINCTIQADVSVHQRGSIIGGALATCSMLVIDPDSRDPRPVPLGFSGELAIGGPQVSPGYLNRPEQTAAAFVDSATYGRIYRTGDRARVVLNEQDGSLVIDFLGRITTEQVKLSGRRVDLGDIEAVTAAVPAVAEVAAIAHQQRQGEKGSEHVVVCIVPRDGLASDMQQLLRECREKCDAQLQPYMRPSRYFVTGIMPRSISGKIDRKRIQNMVAAVPRCPDLTELVSVNGTSGASPSWADDEQVSKIAGILADVTGLSSDDITPDSGLLSIGLDSLRAVKFLQQLRVMGVQGLAINEVLATITVSDLVHLCTGTDVSAEQQSTNTGRAQAKTFEWDAFLRKYQQKHLKSCIESLALAEADIEVILPTTSNQAGMLASFLRSQHQQSFSESVRSYINHSIYELTSGLVVEDAVRAWETALACNEMLRTVFVQVDEETSPFAQCILSKDCDLATITMARYSVEEGQSFDDAIKMALKRAEDTITPEEPMFKVAIVSSEDQHAVVFSLAHPIFDGGSLQLMVQDVEREFQGQAPLPRTSLTDAVARHFCSDREASAAHWRKELEGDLSEPFPSLLGYYPGQDKDLPATTTVTSNLSIQDLREKSRQLSSSPLAVLHAAWALILFAYTGAAADVTFGSVMSDRLDEAMAQCFAPTFVTVPMRVSLPLINAASPATVMEVARRLTKSNVESLNHLHTPLSSVTSADGGLPYDTLFAFQDFPADNAAEGGMYTKVTYPPMMNDFAVMVEVWPTTSGKLELKVTYDRKVLDAPAAQCMMSQLDAAIQFVLDCGEQSFFEGKTLTQGVFGELISGILAARSDNGDEEMVVHKPLEKHAADSPDDLALVFQWDVESSEPSAAVQMTYGELNRAADNLARKLVSSLGEVRNQVVPLCMEKCPELYLAVLAVNKAGCAWCPVDPYSPPARQNDIIKRAGASVVLAAHSMKGIGETEAVPEGVEVIDVTSFWTNDQFNSDSQPMFSKPDIKPSDNAYLIFTSGTTGPPKGVPITHAAASAAFKSMSEVFPDDPESIGADQVRTLQFSHFTFDVFIQDLFYTWRVGGCLVAATREITLGSFARLSNLTRCTTAVLTPTFGGTVLRKDVETLRVVGMIGEKLGQNVADDWSSGGVALYNTYGPAEAAVTSTVRQVSNSDPSALKARSSNVGWPLPSLGAYILSPDNGRPVMKNAIGELVLTGIQLSKGYWAAPEISATKMVWNEALQQDIYHTGDFCRQLASDGSFDFVGRNDDLIKISGQRVELGEISHAIQSGGIDLVEQVEVAYPKRPGSDDNVLVCFVACGAFAASGTAPAAVVQDSRAVEVAAAVVERAESMLPFYMVPAVTLVLTKIPQTPSAKADRKELIRLLSTVDLQAWEDQWKGTQSLQGAPSSVCQPEAQRASPFAILLEAAAEVTKLPSEKIQASSSLAALGIDSIKAIRLTAKLRAAGLKLSVLDVFKCRTLGDVAALFSTPVPDVSREKAKQDDAWELALRKFQKMWYGPVCVHLQSSRFEVAPTSTTQEGMLTESMRQPLSYWGVHCYQLGGGVEVERLRDAWSRVVSETEALRVAFVPAAALADAQAPEKVDATFLQVVYDKFVLPWTEETVEGGDVIKAVQANLESTAHKHHAAGFSQPPWQITILNHGESRYMVLNFHHAIYDGDSFHFLEQDVMSAYSQLKFSSTRCQLSEAMMRSTMGSEESTSTKFWKQELQNFDCSESGRLLSSKKPASESGSIVHRTQEINMSITGEKIAGLAAEFDGHLSVTSLLRVAFGQMLSELMESPDVLFAEIKSDRVLDPRLVDAVAPLVSVIPVPFRSSGSPRSLVKDQHRLSNEGLKNRFVRSSAIRSLVGKSASEPLYPAVFVFHPHSGEEVKSGKELWRKMDDLVDIAVEHPLALNAFDTGNGNTILSFSVDESVMTAAQQNVFLRQINALVNVLVSHPETEDVNKLTEHLPRELQSISAPRKNSNCPSNEMPTAFIGHWAREHPDWKAVEVATSITDDGAETASWTYAEFEKKSNQVASYILSQGISDKMVGMCLDSTLISFAVLVGIIKSGNAYVPLEKDLPQERKEFLLQDSAAPMLFTSGSLFDRASKHNVSHIIDVEDKSFLYALDEQSDTLTHTVDLDGNAYLLYTSGSTGKPKGVCVSRRNLSSFMEGQSQLFYEEVPATESLAGKGKYMCLASRAFDVHLGETFLAWRHGLCAVTAPRTLLLDDLQLALQTLHVTHASFVPSLLDQTGLRPEDVPELRFLGVGGEKMTPRTQSIWAAPKPGSDEDAGHQVSLINAYGPTEATIGCCSGRLYKDTDTQNIGRPLGDCVAHVLAPGSDMHVKRGMPGELCFTGSFIANGYHNRPDAAGFVDDFHGERMYRTGDIVCLMPDDTIYFLGRKDDQVKVRGQRLELGEVSEAVRSAASEVAASETCPEWVGAEKKVDVQTLLLKHPDFMRQQLVAFVAAAGASKKMKGSVVPPTFLDAHFTSCNETLRPICQRTHPAYMVPDLVVPVSYMPLTQTSAKADTKLLKSLFFSVPAALLFGGHYNQSNGDENTGDGASSRDLTPQEQAIVEIAQSFASTNPNGLIVRPDTTIFQLGIDSLGAISVYARMKKLEYECSVATILSGATIEQLAALPKKTTAKSDRGSMSSPELSGASTPLTELDQSLYLDGSALSGIVSGKVSVVRPCLPLQEVLIAQSMDRDDETETPYVNHIVFEMAQDLDVARLINAWDRVIVANEILRTCFTHTDKGMAQVVLKPEAMPLAWSQVMKGDVDLEELKASISRNIVDNVETHPPIRLTLVSSADVIILSIHHALYDGESLPMVMEDVKETYLRGTSAARPLIGALVDYVTHKKTKALDASKKYWTSLLSDWSPAELACNAESSSPVTIETTVNTRIFNRPLSSLEQDCAKHSLTLPALLQAIFGVCLAQLHNHGSATYGSVLSGRTIPVEGIERMMAPCIVTLPQRINLRGKKAVSEAVAASQRAGFEVLDHTHTATRDIQAWVGADRPLFDAIFSFARKMAASDNGDDFLTERASHMSLDYALAVECEADAGLGKLVVRAGFTSLFGSSLEADLLLEKMEILVDAVLRGESLPVGEYADPSGVQRLMNCEPRGESGDGEWSPLEIEVRDVVAGFCKISASGISKATSFIHMGIDSVTAIPFARQLREKGVKVTASQVIRARCIGTLAEQVEAKRDQKPNGVSTGAKADAQVVNIEALKKSIDAKPWGEGDEVVTVYPCTPLQTGMLSLTLAIDPRLYSHHHTIILSSHVDADCLKASWTALVAENDILRTAFHRQSGNTETPWAAAVHKQPLIRWDAIVTEDMNEALDQLNNDTQFLSHVDFEYPPIKTTLIKDASQTVFVISMHHVTYDGMSIPFLFDDLQRAYLQQSTIERPAFSQAALAIATTTKAASDFWGRQMQGYKGNEIPLTEEERNNTGVLTAATLSLAVDNQQVVIPDIALLAFAKALCCLVGARDVVFGHVVSGRNIAVDGADKIIGPMFNTIPFRVRLSRAMAKNKDVLNSQIRQLSEEALDYQHASLVEVQKLWRQQGGAGAQTAKGLFDSLFVFQKTALPEEEDEKTNDVLWKAYEGEGEATAPSEYAMNFEVEQTEQGILVRAFSKLNTERLAAFLDDFKAAFDDILAHPEGLALGTPRALSNVPLEAIVVPSTSRGEQSFNEDAIGQYSAPLRQALADFANIPIEQVSLETSIFSLSVDSISAITIVSSCKRKGVKVGVVDIIQGMTVGRICELAYERSVKIKKTVSSAQAVRPILDDATKLQALMKLGVKEDDVEDVLPLLSGQEYHLSAWLKSGRTMYEPSWVFRTNEPLEESRLREAWATLRKEHSVLRSSFVATSPGRAVQVVLTASAIDDDKLNFYVSEASGAGLEESTKTLAHEIARTPSTLFTPPARLYLVHGGPGEGDAVLVTVQHAAYDAWTMVRFVQQLESLYQGKSIAKTTPFKDFIQHTIEDKHTSDEQFWQQHLSGAESTLIAPQHQLEVSKSKKQTFIISRGTKVDITLLEAAARNHGATPQSILVLAFARLLSRTTNATQPTFGLFHLGRSSAFEGIDEMYGPTINLLPFSAPTGSSAMSELLTRTQASMASRVPHEQSRLRDVLGQTGVKFNTALNLLWNDGLMLAPASGTYEPLLKAFAIGVPTDYSSETAIEGVTAADALETSWIPSENLFVDVGPNRETGRVDFGVRCDAVLFDEEELRGFVGGFEEEIEGVVKALSERSFI